MTEEEIDAIIAAGQYHPNVAWRRIPGKGRGVFALRAFSKGAILDWAPITPLPASDLPAASHADSRVLQYIFTMGTEPGKENAYGWGLLAMYNHSKEPNIELVDGPVPDSMAVQALRDIAVGEELCFDYGYTWFDVV